jgi:transcriptional regulator with XRE-family HTH domain
MPFIPAENGDLEYHPMEGAKLLEARLTLGMKRLEFGHLLGMTGENRNIYSTIKRYEEARRDISPTVERLVLMLLWHKSDFGYLPDLDRGERVPAVVPTEFTSLEAGFAQQPHPAQKPRRLHQKVRP